MVMKTAHIKKKVFYSYKTDETFGPTDARLHQPGALLLNLAALRLRGKTQLHEIMQSRSISMETERTGRVISIWFLEGLHHGHI